MFQYVTHTQVVYHQPHPDRNQEVTVVPQSDIYSPKGRLLSKNRRPQARVAPQFVGEQK